MRAAQFIRRGELVIPVFLRDLIVEESTGEIRQGLRRYGARTAFIQVSVRDKWYMRIRYPGYWSLNQVKEWTESFLELKIGASTWKEVVVNPALAVGDQNRTTVQACSLDQTLPRAGTVY